MQMITIDGAYGEGGGQIFRTALAYAAVMRKPVRVINIRAKRSNPGLRPQHLAALKAIAQLTNAKVSGAYVGSRVVEFIPQRIKGGKFTIDIGTAGSISLVIQAILPALLFADDACEVVIRGGTDVKWAPPIDAVRFVLFPALRRLGAKIELELIRRGHYPRGGGIVKLYTEPIDGTLKPINLTEQGTVKAIKGISHCVRLPKHVAERQAKAAKNLLMTICENVNIELEWYPRDKDPHLGPGSGIVLWAETTTNAILEFDALGERGKPAEKVGEEAARGLIDQINRGGAVDVHHTDQLIPYMALAKGESKILSSEISLHTLTAIHVAEKLIGAEFKVEGNQGEKGLIYARGIGLARS